MLSRATVSIHDQYCVLYLNNHKFGEARHRCNLTNEQLKGPIVALCWTGWPIKHFETGSICTILHEHYNLDSQEQQNAATQVPPSSKLHSVCAFAEFDNKSPQREVVMARLVNMRKDDVRAHLQTMHPSVNCGSDAYFETPTGRTKRHGPREENHIDEIILLYRERLHKKFV